MNWSQENQHYVGGIILLIVFIGCLIWAASHEDRLRQYEVTLGDGTRATCVVVQGYRSAGVNCVPHIVTGPEAEDVEAK